MKLGRKKINNVNYNDPEQRRKYYRELYQRRKEEYKKRYQKWKINNPEIFKESMKRGVIKYRRKLKLEFIKMLGGKCIKCGEKHPIALVFHHDDPELKEHRLWHAQPNYFRRLVEKGEIILFCRNCHQKYHHPDAYKEYCKENDIY